MGAPTLPAGLPAPSAATAPSGGSAAAQRVVPQYRIQLRDHSLVPIGELTDFIDADLVLNFNDVGAWTLTVRALNNPMAASFAAGNGIIISRDRGDGSGAQTIFSGPIWHLERTGLDDAYLLAGVSDDVWLKARLALPATAQAYDTRTGTASTVLWQYTNVNAGPGAASGRPVAGLALATDPVLGTSVTGNARYDGLLALLQQLAISGGGLGFRVLQTDNGVLTFSIYQPQTQNGVIFSRELGNLLDYSYTLDGPTANFDYAGGGGVGAARLIVTDSDATSIATWGRFEAFIDARDTSDTPTITQRINADLAQNAQQTNLSITPQDTAAVSYARDYNLGDVVSVQIDGATITDTVRQVHIQLNGSDQELVSPGIGNAGSGVVVALFDAKQRALRAIQQQLHRLQAAQ